MPIFQLCGQEWPNTAKALSNMAFLFDNGRLRLHVISQDAYYASHSDHRSAAGVARRWD